jgi:hypothetical protein
VKFRFGSSVRGLRGKFFSIRKSNFLWAAFADCDGLVRPLSKASGFSIAPGRMPFPAEVKPVQQAGAPAGRRETQCF